MATILAPEVQAAPRSSLAANASVDCIEALLAELGWTVQDPAGGPAPAERLHEGDPCTRASVAEARALGDLTLLRATGTSSTEWRSQLDRALDSPATECAFSIQVGDAARRATQALSANPGYRFTGLQLGWIGFGPRGAQAQGWTRFRSLGRGYRPLGSNSGAMEAFTHGRVRTECGVGRQVAQLATLRELFGDDAFDTAFSSGELSIGTFLTLHRTESVLLGSGAGPLDGDGKAVRTAARGRQAFMGLPGYVVHAFDATFVDDQSNQAENFVVVDVDAAAAAALARHGGFVHYDAVNREVWRLAATMQRPGYKGFERLLYERDPGLRARLTTADRATVAQIDALFDDPFYRGFVVYVHPMGAKPIGYHVARLLDRNPRTPFEIELTVQNLHGTVMDRWIAHRLHACAAAM